MTKEKSPPLRKLKYLAVIPMTALLMVFFSCAERSTDTAGPLMNTEDEAVPSSTLVPISEGPSGQRELVDIDENEPVFVFVENTALFQGGDLNDFRIWVQENLVYPPEAVENNIFGRVTVQFTVDSQGEIKDVVILRGIDETLDNEVIRVILSSPKWSPASQGERNVAQQFTIPVVFSLTQ